MKTKLWFVITGLMLASLVAVSGFSGAFGGSRMGGYFGDNDAIENALETGNYTAYMNALEAAVHSITEEKFNNLVAIHKQRAENITSMQEKRQETPFGGERFTFFDNEEAKKALEAEDYDAFIKALEATNTTSDRIEEMTQEKFAELVDFYKQHAAMEEEKQKLQEAIQNNDYDAWRAAINNTGRMPPFADKITKDNFSTFVKLVEAQRNGDLEIGQELSEELGIQQPQIGPGWFHDDHPAMPIPQAEQ